MPPAPVASYVGTSPNCTSADVNAHSIIGWTKALEISVFHQTRLVCKLTTSVCSVNTLVLSKYTFCTELLSVKSKLKLNPLRFLSCSALNQP